MGGVVNEGSIYGPSSAPYADMEHIYTHAYNACMSSSYQPFLLLGTLLIWERWSGKKYTYIIIVFVFIICRIC